MLLTEKKGVSQKGQTPSIILICSYCVLDRPEFDRCQTLLHPELTPGNAYMFPLSLWCPPQVTSQPHPSRNVWRVRGDGHNYGVISKRCGVTITTSFVEWMLSISKINVFFYYFQELSGLENTNDYANKVWDISKTTWAVGIARLTYIKTRPS